MDLEKREARYFVATNGKAPCEEWLEGLKDRQGRAIIRARIRRLEEGNSGKCRSVGMGVMELKIDFGPGYRVYYGEDGNTLILLLCGGDKNTQSKDIARAHELWHEYWRGK